VADNQPLPGAFGLKMLLFNSAALCVWKRRYACGWLASRL